VTFAFRGVHYYVPHPNKKEHPGEELHLLDAVSGYFVPGEMTALMGSSGGRPRLSGAPRRTLRVRCHLARRTHEKTNAASHGEPASASPPR